MLWWKTSDSLEGLKFSRWPFELTSHPTKFAFEQTAKIITKRTSSLFSKHTAMKCMRVWVSSVAMPTSVRIGEEQLNHLASLARLDYSISGRVFMKNHENAGKWLQRWVALYQNFLFYFESEDSTKLSGAIYLEHCICERLCLTNLKDSENQVSFMTARFISRFCIFCFTSSTQKSFLFYCSFLFCIQPFFFFSICFYYRTLS